MTFKRFTFVTLGISIGALFLIATTTYLVDPYYQYHRDIFSHKPIRYEEYYQNLGIARNFEYDALITGPSTTENFIVSNFNDAFNCNAILLPFSGGHTEQFEQLLTMALNSNDNLKKVFLSLDPYIIMNDSRNCYMELPTYFNNTTILDDAAYLLNKDVFIYKTMDKIKHNINGTEPDFVGADSWYNSEMFSEKNTVESYIKDGGIREFDTYNQTLMEIAEINTNKIAKIVKENPQTTFYIYTPPYSVLFWKTLDETSRLNEWADGQIYAASVLSNCSNVKLYCFAAAQEMITNLDLYKDVNHFNLTVDEFILNSMANESYLVTASEYAKEIEKMLEIYNQYDFEKLISKYR